MLAIKDNTKERILKVVSTIVLWELEARALFRDTKVKPVTPIWSFAKNLDTKEIMTIVALNDGYVYFVKTVEYRIHSIEKEPYAGISIDGSLIL